MRYPKRCPDIGFRLEFSFLPQTLYRSGANGNEECSFTNPVRGPFPVSRRDVVPVRIGDAPISHLLVPGATASLHASWSLTVPFLKREEHPGSAEILCSPAPFQRGWTRARSFTATYGARSSRSPCLHGKTKRLLAWDCGVQGAGPTEMRALGTQVATAPTVSDGNKRSRRTVKK